MMNNFEVQASYAKETPDGTFKKVKEWYLLTDPVSFTDAETTMYDVVADGIRGEFAIHQIKKTDYKDIVPYDDADYFYKCKLTYKVENPDTGKEKKTSMYILMAANTVDTATARIHTHMDGQMIAYEIESVTKTPIVELIMSDKAVAETVEE